MSRVGFEDPAGGSGGDSMTLAIAESVRHADRLVLRLLVIREARPPFSPEAIVTEHAALLKAYGLACVTGDRYAGEWPREQFRKHGITYVPCELAKSDLYRELLPLINSGRIELLDHPRLLAQLAGLERRTGRNGRDTIDHSPGAHDDLANVAAGALVLTMQSVRQTSPEFIAQCFADAPDPYWQAPPWSNEEEGAGGEEEG